MGNVLEKSGRRSQALSEMEKILAEKPDDASALNFIGYTLSTMGKEPERAEAMVRKALELKPDDGYILDSLAWILFKNGKVDEAHQYVEKAIEKVKSDPVIAEHLGDILLAKNDKAAAVDAYRRSLQVNPENLLVQKKLLNLEKDVSAEKKE